MNIFSCLVILLLGSYATEGAKILGIFPTPGKSHMISNSALMKGLAARGHEVTVLSSHPLDSPMKNYKDLVLPNIMEEILKYFNDNYNPLDGKDSKSMISMAVVDKLMEMYSERAMSTKTMRDLISSNEKFDLIILELFFTEVYMGFFDKFKVPVIAMSSNVAMNFIAYTIGNPYPYSYVPDVFTRYTDKMSFWERLDNAWVANTNLLYKKFVMNPRQEALMKKYFNRTDMPSIPKLEERISLIITNSHFTFNSPRPNLPNLIEAGGMHIKKPKPLPKDLQEFLDNSKEGVIYFSMGSGLRSMHFPEEKRKIFLEVFSKLKQNVLWKWEDEQLLDKPKNVKIGKWLPQNDILAHPNIQLFITHGGLLSTQEAIYHGVPVVGLPVLGDQLSNMEKSSSMGYGVKVDLATLTVDSFSSALNEVLRNSRYREKIQRMSKIFRDQPMTPLETAVFWTEYVIRHNGAPHMKSAALDLYWFQYFLLDVIAFLVLALFLVMFIVYKCIRLTLRLIFPAKTESIKKKNK